MKKRITAILLTAVLLLSACQGTSQQAQAPTAAKETQTSTAEGPDPSLAATSQSNETSDAKDTSIVADAAEWTVFIYLCGTDLESDGAAASGNLESLGKAAASNQVNFVIQTGGTETWHRDDIKSDVLTRFTMNGGVLTEVESLPLANMGDPNTLGSFLSWGVKNYPAKKYMAVLWDHGGGPMGGAIVDQLYDNSSMTVPELAKAISMAETQFEIIGFDACLMASLEIADAMSPYGKYLVASEETEPGDGWDYGGFGSYLVENPECDGIELGKKICDTYMDLNNKTEEPMPNLLTLSVVDLAKIDPINQAFGNLVLEMGAMIPDVSSYRKLVQEISYTEKYLEYANTIDLGDMAQRASHLNPEAAQQVSDALNDAVLYTVNGNTRLHSNGLSISYLLNSSQDTYDLYADICPVPEYLAYLDSINYGWRAPDWVYEKVSPLPEPVWKDYHVDFELGLNENGQGELRVTEGKDTITNVVYKLYRFDNNEQRAYCLGDGKEISGDFETGIFNEEFDGLWPSIGGAYCFPHEVDYQKEYTLYDIPVRVDGDRMLLKAAYFPDGENSHYQLYGLMVGGFSISGIPSRNTYPLEDGMEITFLFPEINNSISNALQYRDGETIIYDSESTHMEDIRIKDGNYAMKYEITDVLGRKYTSDLLTLTCQNGNITREIPDDDTEE